VTAADQATARFMEDWLQRQYPGTVWDVTLEAAQDGISTETLPWEIAA
jgi:hypothetical protein